MALRNQPYIPLYVQDFLTDEKLSECSAESTGVYIRLMCLMHKSEEYGVIKLKAKYKQNQSIIGGFAEMLTKQMPYSTAVIERALLELLEEKVCYLDDDSLCQKRMIRDGDLSSKRASAGAKGGKSVKNSPTRALYNEPGYIYLFADVNAPGVFKIGISKNPRKRLQDLSSASGKELECVYTQECFDMGDLEGRVLQAFERYRDGEWVSGIDKNTIIKEMQNQMQIQKQTASKKQANTESESEYENENESVGDIEGEDTVTRVKPNLQTERFDDFWSRYPKKVGKEAARKSWLKVKPNAALFEKIINAVETAKFTEQWRRDNGRFIPNPATWLNQGRWDDELPVSQGSPRTPMDDLRELHDIFAQEEDGGG